MNVSIIIPSYNQAPYLPEAIESALSQTVKCEIIVVDDGSTDDSLQIAWGYNVKVISQVNKGLPSARNTGIMNASGEWILPLDADDILLPTAVEELMKYPEYDIIAPSFRQFGISNAEIILSPEVTWEDMAQSQLNYLPYFCLIRKSKLLEIGGYSPRMFWGYEDYHLWFNLLKRGAKLKVLQEILALYRTKANSMLATSQQHHGELLGQIQKDFHVFT